MENEKKLELLEEMLDMESGTLVPAMVLKNIEEWDSVAIISFIALMDDEFDKQISGNVVREQKTVADLLALMEKA